LFQQALSKNGADFDDLSVKEMFEVVNGTGRHSLEVDKKSVFLELEETKLKEEKEVVVLK
jgi:hypothetical protein